jgi:two-component system response regulator YesN
MKYILVVDDEIDILETIVDSLEVELEEKDVSISFSNLPAEALRMFIKENNFDLVVTDLKMPLMNGLELSKKLKSINNETAIIVFTGHGDNHEQQQLKEIGVTIMIKKPNIRELVESVTFELKL